MAAGAAAASMPEADQQIERPVRVLIGLLLGAAFVMILNETVMGVALPHIMAAFEVTAATAQWLTTIYLLTMAVVIPATGFLLDHVPTRVVFLVAVSVFVIGTAAAAAAPTFGVLLLARMLQAVGSAIILPLLTTTVMREIPESRRGQMMGFVAIVIAVAPAIGPTFSGAVLQVASWRVVYIAVLPFAIAALVAGWMLVRNQGPATRGRFDLTSFALSTVAFASLVYGLSSIGEAAVSDVAVPPLVPIMLGFLAGAVFVRRQVRLQRGDGAFLDLRPLRVRPYVLCLILVLLAMCTLFGVLILVPIYLQEVLHRGSFVSGLMLLPGGLVMGLIGPPVGRIYDRRGPRALVVTASAVLCVAVVLFLSVDPGTPVWFIVVAHMTICLALGLLFTPCITFALGHLSEDLYAHGSAIMNALQQLAGAAGTALFVAVATVRQVDDLDAGVPGDRALGNGIHAAFWCGLALTVAMIAVSFFVKGRPAAAPKGAVVH